MNTIDRRVLTQENNDGAGWNERIPPYGARVAHSTDTQRFSKWLMFQEFGHQLCILQFLWMLEDVCIHQQKVV